MARRGRTKAPSLGALQQTVVRLDFGAASSSSSQLNPVHGLYVQRQTDQAPFALHVVQTTQAEPALGPHPQLGIRPAGGGAPTEAAT